jgi:ABC-2 type transport system ATP-binding protein
MTTESGGNMPTLQNPPDDVALQVRHVFVRYGKRSVLQDITLSVPAGEGFGLIGANGAGKSTLIRAILDLLAVERGDIALFGTPWRVAAARRCLAYLPERFLPPHYLRGREFLRYVLALYGESYDDVRARETVAELDLDPAALSRPVRSYSKGMTQKIGLAGCLLAQRRLLILDEPFSGLDPKARARLKQRLQRERAQGGTLIFSSHALPDVELLCDRFALLHAGRIRFLGTAAECIQRYGGATLEDAYLACIDQPMTDEVRP